VNGAGWSNCHTILYRNVSSGGKAKTGVIVAPFLIEKKTGEYNSRWIPSSYCWSKSSDDCHQELNSVAFYPKTS